MAPSVSFLTGIDSILVCLWQRLIILSLSKTGLQTGLSLNALNFSNFNKADHSINDDLLVPLEDLRTNP